MVLVMKLSVLFPIIQLDKFNFKTKIDIRKLRINVLKLWKPYLWDKNHNSNSTNFYSNLECMPMFPCHNL